MINAVAGLAAALVDGSATPDQYVVEMAENGQPIRVSQRMIARQTQVLTGDRPRSLRSAAVG